MTYLREEWRLMRTPPADGAWNMAVDEAILEAVIAGAVPNTLRFYAWKPACLSLGFAQPVADVDQQALEKQGWELVRRPTGGKAILHVDELTYAVIGSEKDPRLAGGVLESYRNLSKALLAALHILDIPAQALERPATLDNPSVNQSPDQNPACFEAPSNYEITVIGKKLLGSAQARRKGGVLQHGSLPLFGDLTRILQALKFPDQAASARAASRLLERAITVQGATGRIISWEAAAVAFARAFGEVLNLELVMGDITPEELRQTEQLFFEKYTNPEWTGRV